MKSVEKNNKKDSNTKLFFILLILVLFAVCVEKSKISYGSKCYEPKRCERERTTIDTTYIKNQFNK